jgi:uncharacterized protein YgbK (DUF1537 family)
VIRPLLGCIADDFTGATDAANNLAHAGMRVTQTIGVLPWGDENLSGIDAVVVSLKSRTVPAAEAISMSLEACRWLRARGVQQIYFKVCSTFDSTVRGNIGPVIEALMDELACNFCVITPAFPQAARTVYQGYLFVGSLLLSESGMKDHPLTPMTDANLVRALQAQLDPARGRRVGLLSSADVAAGSRAICARLDVLQRDGFSLVIADATMDDDLKHLGRALKGAPIVAGGSGLIAALPQNWDVTLATKRAPLPAASGFKLIISGSCSSTTNAQVAHFLSGGGTAYRLLPEEMFHTQSVVVQRVVEWASAQWQISPHTPVLLYSTADVSSVRETQAQFGIDRAGEIIENTLAAVGRALVLKGAGQLIVAGGETSGRCVQELGVQSLRIGPQIAPGVPWCYATPFSTGGRSIHLALKSGNFGSEGFFTEAFELLDRGHGNGY